MSRRIPAQPRGITSPYSVSRPRRPLIDEALDLALSPPAQAEEKNG
jgi:hypothetical protein